MSLIEIYFHKKVQQKGGGVVRVIGGLRVETEGLGGVILD